MSESVDAFVGLFPNHAIVRLDGDQGWGARDANHQLTALDGKDALLKLIDSDPPRVTGDLELAKRYALFIDQIEHPDDKRIDSFQSIVWKDELTAEEQQRIGAVRAKDHVEPPVAELSGDHVSVQFWVTSTKRLIHRFIKVQPDGHYSYYDSSWAEDLPLVATTPKKFASLDAFRSYFGVPTMPIEQCRLCRCIPERTSRHVEDYDVEDDRPGEMLDLKVFLDGERDGKLLRCPVCKRLYFERTTFGVGYFDYDSYWTRYDVDDLFNAKWSVAKRLPERRVKAVEPGDTPNHVKVQFEDEEGWSTLDANNRLTPPETKAPIAKPTAIDPPRVPDKRPETVPVVVKPSSIFESLDAFRAHCGEPSMPLEQCVICRKIPERCTKGDDVVPPEIEQLVDFIESGVRRCPACRRLYLYDEIVFGNDIYTGNDSTWTLQRFRTDALFDVEWCVKQRLPHLDVSWVHMDRFFPQHVLVRFGSGKWGALDSNNQLAMLTSRNELAKVIDADPPRVTDDLALATRYAFFVDGIERPDDKGDDNVRPIALEHVDKAVTERRGEEVIVQFLVPWYDQQKQRRFITLQPDGHYHWRWDALPIAPKRASIFESLDAFRAVCGEPTMPLEQCPICRTLPEHSGGESACDPPEIEPLEPFIGDVLRCPLCHRLYCYETFSGGNDIYRGNERTYSLDRYTPRALFDSDWGVRQRLPNLDVSWIGKDRFFPNHVLVRFGGTNPWGALGPDNQLVMLTRHDAIAKLIDSDPPRVTADLELAKRYALFVDERDRPEDERPDYFENIKFAASLSPEQKQQIDDAKAATGLPEMVDPVGWHDMRPTAEHDGERVIVRFWFVSQKQRLCRRVITVQPNGQFSREDTVIAERLPIDRVFSAFRD